MQTSIIGIDPGVVHTGCVALLLDESTHTIDVIVELIQGVDVSLVRQWVDKQIHPDRVFIEDYNPGNFGGTDKRMSEAVGRLKAEFPPEDGRVKYVDNAGINTLIPVAVQKVFGVHHFPITTHHNDLNSAGKIALLGMLQDKGGLLQLASQVVAAELVGKPWHVIQHA